MRRPGLSVRGAAKELAISGQHLSLLERGERRLQAHHIARMQRAYRLTAEQESHLFRQIELDAA